MVGDQLDSGESEVVADSLSFSARHNAGRARSGAATRNAAAVSETAMVSACAVRFNARCQQVFNSCAIRFTHLPRAFRIWHVQATRAYRVEALGALHAMSLLRARESEAFVARSSRGVIRAASRLGCQEPVWAVSGHGEGEGMVKS